MYIEINIEIKDYCRRKLQEYGQTGNKRGNKNGHYIYEETLDLTSSLRYKNYSNNKVTYHCR